MFLGMIDAFKDYWNGGDFIKAQGSRFEVPCPEIALSYAQPAKKGNIIFSLQKDLFHLACWQRCLTAYRKREGGRLKLAAAKGKLQISFSSIYQNKYTMIHLPTALTSCPTTHRKKRPE